MKPRAALILLAVAFTSCGTVGTGPVKPAAAPEPVTGLHALYQMYTATHAWAPDALIYEFNSIHLSDVQPAPGKAGAWQAKFVSMSLQQSKTYTFSVAEESTSLHQGVNSGKAESWSGPNASTQPFPIAAAKIDTDTAYRTALTKAAAFDSKHPGMTITYQLAETKPYGNAAWRVLWGESASTSEFSVVIDATSGAYVETLH